MNDIFQATPCIHPAFQFRNKMYTSLMWNCFIGQMANKITHEGCIISSWNLLVVNEQIIECLKVIFLLLVCFKYRGAPATASMVASGHLKVAVATV